jgi:ribosome-associated translation inhibitor RaiA
MLVETRTHSLDLVGAIHRHLERRVRAALRSSATHVRGATLWLSDTNGPRGGPDLHCAVSLDLIPRGSVRGEATDSDILAAIARALARARRSIHRGGRRHRDASLRPSSPATLYVRAGRRERRGREDSRRGI